MSELKRAVYCNECQTVDLYGAEGVDDETAADEDLACRRCGHDRSAWVCEVFPDTEREYLDLMSWAKTVTAPASYIVGGDLDEV